LEVAEIDTSLLPGEREWDKDALRDSLFNYVNKISALRDKKSATEK